MPRLRTPVALDRRFEAIVFEWEGTAVRDARADASVLRDLLEQLCALGLHAGVVTGASVRTLDAQLRARPGGPGRLYLCANRGSEVFRADEQGVHLLERRETSREEVTALDAAAAATVEELAKHGLQAATSAPSPGRRRIDLAPAAQRSDPAASDGAQLLVAVEQRLYAAGVGALDDVAALAERAARAAGLAGPRVSSDAGHVEIGLADDSDSTRWLLHELMRRGIGPGLVLIAGGDSLLVEEAGRSTAVSVGLEPGDSPSGAIALGGGPERFLALLADQLERRRRCDPPEIDADPSWTLTIEGLDARLERVHEALLTIADGCLGTRGSPLLAHPAAQPGVLKLGAYTGDGSETELAPCHDWAALPGSLPKTPALRRRLNLRAGLLRQEGPVTALQLSCLARPGTVAMRAAAPPAALPRSRRGRVPRASEVYAALTDARHGPRVERLGAYADNRKDALELLEAAEAEGFERLLLEHRRAWASRWQEADVVVEGDPELQLAVRLALFHLMASVPDSGEAAVGARGLSGGGYRGHVFWDSDCFVLPFLAATHPASARAMLEYRIRRLPAARAAAAAQGREGARLPWESARDGFDVTPSHAHLPTGEVVRIRTGEDEEHITADVAWAAACYLDWTGDQTLLDGEGRDLFLETARYWASRVRVDAGGRAHLYGVIGPDEYHEPVDDNAFTNVMARWNLRRGAELAASDAERARWLEIADALVDGYDPMSGLYEQFAGFFELEPLVIADVAPQRPIAADLFLGAERTRGAQVLKQADVLMLHHLLPGEVAHDSLSANLDYYEPRTAHGSSLSPAIHASLLARAGRFREALQMLRIAARIDLDDLTGSTASGLHMATMGGLWQAFAFGFAGLRPQGQVLRVDPRLPQEWPALELRLRFRGSPLRLRIERGGVELDAGPELALVRRNDDWEVVPQ